MFELKEDAAIHKRGTRWTTNKEIVRLKYFPI